MESAVWAKGKSEEKNITLAFVYERKFANGAQLTIKVAASNVYKMYIGGRLSGYGPARCAHGYARIDEYVFTADGDAQRIVFEVASYRINSYIYINEPPFFACEVFVDGKRVAVAEDFACYILDDRVQKVQRYSFQRAFAEYYRINMPRMELYTGKIKYPRAETCVTAGRKYLPRGVPLPQLCNTETFKEIERGGVEKRDDAPVLRNKPLTDIGEKLLGYPMCELEEILTDTASGFVYLPDKCGIGCYALYDANKEYSGFINMQVRVREHSELYIIFDEILGDGCDENGARKLDFTRMGCCNVVKYELDVGEYAINTFEPYSLRYLRAVIFGDAEVERVWMSEVKSDTAESFKFTVEDNEIQLIANTARRTFEQNAVDILMDCPSRERAGWTNDSYFSGQADRLFTGTGKIEKNFLENLLLAPQFAELPQGMIPMCYPSDHLDGVYIPNCAMWFALQLCDRLKSSTMNEPAEVYKEKVYDVIRYFEKYENEEGLLEDLEGWIFIEWSECGNDEHLRGVNFPSNMMWYGVLRQAGELFVDRALLQRAERLRIKIREYSFNGEYYEDNCERENKKLIRKGHITETCQYYAFFFDVADEENDKLLYNRLFEQNRNDFLKNEPCIARSNMIAGLLLRGELLMRYKKQSLLVEESKDVFLKMAIRTSTLWENNSTVASCNHCVASIVEKWLVYAYTGYIGCIDGKPNIATEFLGTNCEFEGYCGSTPIKITVREGNRTVKYNGR